MISISMSCSRTALAITLSASPGMSEGKMAKFAASNVDFAHSSCFDAFWLSFPDIRRCTGNPRKRGLAAGKGDDGGETERGVQPHLWVKPGNNGTSKNDQVVSIGTAFMEREMRFRGMSISNTVTLTCWLTCTTVLGSWINRLAS